MKYFYSLQISYQNESNAIIFSIKTTKRFNILLFFIAFKKRNQLLLRYY
jgi:hypothetical protein